MKNIHHSISTTLFLICCFPYLSISQVQDQVESVYDETEYVAPTKSDFLQLENTKKYQELKNKKSKYSSKPYPETNDFYSELMNIVKADYQLDGFLNFEESITWQTNYANSSVTGFVFNGVSANGMQLNLSVMDEAYQDIIDDFDKVGGSFHFWRNLDWENAELGMENNLIYALQALPADNQFGGGGGDQWAIAVQLTNNALMTLVAPSDEMQKKELIALATGKASNQLLQLLHTQKQWHVGIQDFVTFTQEEWNVEWATNKSFDKIADFLFIGKTLNEPDEPDIRLGFSCKPIENKEYIPYAIKDKAPDEEIETQGLLLQFYKTYAHKDNQRGLFVSDGKSFVELVINEDEDIEQLAQRIKKFFNMPIDCEAVAKNHTQQLALRPEIIDFLDRYQEKEQIKRIDGFVNQIESSNFYQDYLTLLKEMPKANKNKKWKSQDVEGQFQEVLKPISNQMVGKVNLKKDLKVVILPYEGVTEVPGYTLTLNAKTEGKNAEYAIGIFMINESYSNYISYYLKEASSLLFPFDAKAFASLTQGMLTTKMLGDLPTYSFDTARSPINIIGSPVAEHAVLYISGPKNEYSQAELEQILSTLSASDLAAFANSHKNINKAYWDTMKLFPEKFEGNSRAVILHNSKTSKSALSMRDYKGEIVLVTYGSPLAKIEGGHLFFLIDCESETPATQFGELLNTSDTTTPIKKGKYSLQRGQIPNSRYPKGEAVWLVSHENVPNKHVIYTLKKEFNKAELDAYFNAFFDAEIDCKGFKVK